MENTKIDITDMLDSSFVTYSTYVNFHRAIPHYYDGLKNVQRRILYTMYVNKWLSRNPLVKVTRISGQTMGILHPHGNTSIEGALVRMAQPYHNTAPLVFGEGNYGDGLEEPAAAPRYIEAKLSVFGDQFFDGINKNTIPWVDNYDNTTVEPVYLPAPYPQLLISPILGIGVGQMCSIPSHNLGEVIAATKFVMQNEHFTTEDLLQYISGPDFACGCEVVNKEDFAAIYKKGTGSFRLRAKFVWEGNTLIISNFPYGTSASKVEKEILSQHLKFDLCTVVNTTAREQQLRLIFKKHKPEYVQELCWNTSCESTFPLQFKAIEGDAVKLFSLQGFFMSWKKEYLEILRKGFLFDFNKLSFHQEQLEGMVKALDMLDQVIKWIKQSSSRAEAKNTLVANDFTERQADYILDLKLSRLVNTEIAQVKENLIEIQAETAVLKQILDNKEKLIAESVCLLNSHEPGVGRKSKISQTVVVKPKHQESTDFYVRKKGNTVFVSNEYSKDAVVGSKDNPVYVLHENFISPIRNTSVGAFINAHAILIGDQDVYHFSVDGLIKRTEVSKLLSSRKAIATRQNVFTAVQGSGYALITTTAGDQIEVNLQNISATGRGTKGATAVKMSGKEIQEVEIVSKLKEGAKDKRAKKK